MTNTACRVFRMMAKRCVCMVDAPNTHFSLNSEVAFPNEASLLSYTPAMRQRATCNNC